MKLIGYMFFAALLLHGAAHAQTDSLWRGIYLFSDIDHLNFSQLSQSLHINVVQGRTGFGSPFEDSTFLHNPTGLRIINQRAFLNHASSGQKLVYQAEQDSQPEQIREYFKYKHPTLHPDGDSARFLTPPDSAGFMVKSAVPDNEYHYKQTDWWATFRLKIDQPFSAGDTVAHCIVQCKGNAQILADQILLAGDFDSAGVYKEFTLPFNVSYPVQNPGAEPPSPFLSGGVLSSNAAPCGGIDLQVYWYGHVTTYLDKVIVEDSLARHYLFAGLLDSSIKQEAATFGADAEYPLHENFHLTDEPFMSAHLAFNYVANLIKDTLGHDNPRAGSVTASYERFARFARSTVLLTRNLSFDSSQNGGVVCRAVRRKQRFCLTCALRHTLTIIAFGVYRS